MAFYNEKGERIIAIFQDGVLVSDDPEYINFTGNVEVTNDGMGGVVVNVLGSGGGGFTYSNEIVAGSGITFTLAHVPTAPTGLLLFGGGSALIQGVDYMITGAVITMSNSYSAGQVVAFYS